MNNNHQRPLENVIDLYGRFLKYFMRFNIFTAYFVYFNNQW
jgi:hypothetical protein